MMVLVGFFCWVFLFWFAWKWFQFTILSKFISPGGQRAITINKLKQQNRILKKESKAMTKLLKEAQTTRKETKKNKVCKETKKNKVYQEFLEQKIITENYYNTLQKLKEQNQ
jgi:hypothetical protein